MNAKKASLPGSKSPPSRAFDAELAELAALKAGPFDAAAKEKLRRTLAHRNNYVVSQAAKLVAENQITALLPDALAAYERFFHEPAKTDPQCWAKNALVKTLVALEHRDKDAYLLGLRHHQFEPVWGGQSDTAGTLRGACAHALVNCPGVADVELLATLIDLFSDKDKAVRVEAARAIGNVGGPSAVLLLRLRVMVGKGEEPEVLGACFAALLDLEGVRAAPFVARYLEEGDDASAEAAFALAGIRSPEALALLVARRKAFAGDWYDGVLLSAIALCRLPQAIDYLMGLIERDERAAPMAIEAIGRTAPSAEICARVERAVGKSGSPRLEKARREHLPAASSRA